jgi:starch phosphorylase
VTNGVTPRRFLVQANPQTLGAAHRVGGAGLGERPGRAEEARAAGRDAEFRRQWRKVKQANKRDFARWVARTHGLEVDPSRLFDVQIKRIHEYKRQHLAALYAVGRTCASRTATRRAWCRARSSSLARRRPATAWRS